ncbi:adenine phosphoribosyltransferase [Lachnospiraceae bacterium NK3A20]|nr:adenine phosphoribosyltransferase [Lachnospiraceae bacterium NK3A20]
MQQLPLRPGESAGSISQGRSEICLAEKEVDMVKNNLKEYVRTIPDFPEKGIMFRDITTVVQDADGLHMAIDTMEDLVKDLDFDVVVGAESRGFVFGTPIAYNLHKPFALIRKKGKLPWKTVSVDYALEYGTASLEMHEDSFKPGSRILIVDDLMATGGTAKAMIELVEKLGGKVSGVLVLMELRGLKGREALEPYPVFSAIQYEGK